MSAEAEKPNEPERMEPVAWMYTEKLADAKWHTAVVWRAPVAPMDYDAMTPLYSGPQIREAVEAVEEYDLPGGVETDWEVGLMHYGAKVFRDELLARLGLDR